MSGFPHMSDALPKLATPEEVAPVLRTTADTVRQMCREGKLPATKFGSRWLIHVSQLADQIDGLTGRVAS